MVIMTANVFIALNALCLVASLLGFASAQSVRLELRLDREQGSNDLALRCHEKLLDGSFRPAEGANFYVNSTSQLLTTLLSAQDIEYTASEEEGRIQFRLPQDLEAQYFCSLNTYTSTTLTILYYHRAVKVQRSYAVQSGESVTLFCGVNEGALSQSYRPVWYHGFMVVDTADPRYSLQQVPGKDYSLTIAQLVVSDSGPYRCDVEVGVDFHFTDGKTINLTVYDGPTITRPPATTVALAEDGAVTFSCEAQGSPGLEVTWYHNYVLVEVGRGRVTSSKYSINETFQTSAQGSRILHSELTIMSGLSLADSGMVQCMVSTQFSDDTNVLQRPTVGRTAELTVLDGSFHFNTIVTQAGDLQPLLTLSSPLPSLTHLLLRYSPTDGSIPLDQTSNSAYFNISRIMHFVPNSFVPRGVTEFRLQIALKVGDKESPLTPQAVHEAPLIDINEPTDSSEDCERLSEGIIGAITCACIICPHRVLGHNIHRVLGLSRVGEGEEAGTVDQIPGTVMGAEARGNGPREEGRDRGKNKPSRGQNRESGR